MAASIKSFHALPKQPELIVGNTYRGSITYYGGKGKTFYAQVDQNDKILNNVTVLCDNHSATPLDPLAAELTPGKLVLAKYSVDELWYRAIVKEVLDDVGLVEVIFVDYGNSEKVKVTEATRCLHEELTKDPPLAYFMELCGVDDVNADRLLSKFFNGYEEDIAYNINIKGFVPQTDGTASRLLVTVESDTPNVSDVELGLGNNAVIEPVGSAVEVELESKAAIEPVGPVVESEAAAAVETDVLAVEVVKPAVEFKTAVEPIVPVVEAVEPTVEFKSSVPSEANVPAVGVVEPVLICQTAFVGIDVLDGAAPLPQLQFESVQKSLDDLNRLKDRVEYLISKQEGSETTGTNNEFYELFRLVFEKEGELEEIDIKHSQELQLLQEQVAKNAHILRTLTS